VTGWGFTDRPAVSVGNAVGRGLIGGSGAKAAIVDALARGTFTPSQGDGTVYAEATRITVEEAALLQSYGLPSHYPERRTMTKILALDDFAGTGWGVACQRLGIEERGVEIMPEAQATRAANGMHTIGGDIWEHLEATADTPLAYDLLISSPPCQTFSMAGGGAGRRALDEVVALIDSKAYADVAQLRAFGEAHDPRTSLVLTPLVRAYRDAPAYLVFEQVPPVLPIWERMATELRGWGYSVVTGVLNAEQYGVPQTRRRAVLIARADGKEATMPTPTHSRYYSRDPKRLDPGVLPWVSMAQALGWGRTQRPSATVTGGGTETGGAEPLGHLAREVAAEDWVGRRFAGAGTAAERTAGQIPREGEEPPHTVTGKGNAVWLHDRPATLWEHGETGEPIHLDPERPATTVQGDPRLTSREHHYHGEQSKTSTRVAVDEAAALQSYPPAFVWCGTKTKQFLQIGNAVPPLLAEAILRTLLDDGVTA
jgi:DNA (cytosine-5)-methyltransferase 1